MRDGTTRTGLQTGGIAAAAVFVAGAGAALWWEIAGRGIAMAVAYPVGFVIVLMFGLIGLHAASSAWRGGAGSVRKSILRLAAVYAALDAVNVLVVWFDRPLLGALGMAVVHLALIAGLFGLRAWNLLWLGAVTFLIKVVGLTIVPETLYRMFGAGT